MGSAEDDPVEHGKPVLDDLTPAIARDTRDKPMRGLNSKDSWSGSGTAIALHAATGVRQVRSFWLWNSPKLKIGKIPFETALKEGESRPILLTARHQRVEVSVNLEAERLHFLGNVTLPDGYPVIGKYGEQVARYVIVYADGEQQEASLRWGQEIARGNMIAVASRIDPSTAFGERVITYVKEPTREVYQTRLLTVDTKPKMIVRLICELQGSSSPPTGPPPDMHHVVGPPPAPGEQAVVLFAITAEWRDRRL